MPRQLLYATGNPGKLMEVRALLAPHSVPVLGPADLGLALDVAEDGDTLEANAAAKTRAYLQHVGADFVVLGDDTGVEIDALGGAPGIHVRRWDGSARMSDEAIITYCLEQLRGVPPERRGAQFRTVFAVGAAQTEIAYFEGTLRGVILEQADPLRIEGFPFESIFYVPEWEMLLGKLHMLPAEQKAGFVTHREHALRRALPYLRELLGVSGT